MIRLNQSLRNRTSKLLFTAAAGVVLLPSIAAARVHDAYDRGDRYRGDRDDRTSVRIGVNVGGSDLCFPGPVYQDRTERVWVAPVYRTVCERVWVEPLYRTEIQRVWVEPLFEVRDVVRYDGYRRRVSRERVRVSPGRWEDRACQVLVCDGHWATVERQELVAPGHWEYRTTRVLVEDRPSWSFSFGYRK